MQASNCKIGYEVAWKGRRLICVGIYKGVVRFKYHDDTIFLSGTDEVHLPCLKAGIKCVEYHDGVETSDPYMQVYGKPYVCWDSLK